MIDPQAQKNWENWLKGSYDVATKDEIRRLKEQDLQLLIDSFYTHLAFGTGGLRGLMGVGTNRMNIYTIRSATQGLANYIKSLPKTESRLSVFIGYDSRINSKIFAEEAAKVLARNDLYVYLFEDIRPTPFVSFGCRYKKCKAGIMITASHNPPRYNGYKVFWETGGQVLPPHDEKIIQQVNLIHSPDLIQMVGSCDHPLIERIGSEIDEAYFSAIHPLQNLPQQNREEGNDLKVVYTSLHGTGIKTVPRALANWGFSNIALVEEQVIPDGRFPTVEYPNPEEKTALSLGIRKLEEVGGDLFLATDPDADRVGVAIRSRGKTTILTGNQVASLCVAHLCETFSKQKRLPANAAFVKTIVTTELIKAIASDFQRPVADVLTGFKYIAQKIDEWGKDPNHKYQYLFGGEESCGYLLGTHVRDKDAVVASALICEMALAAKKNNVSLLDKLYDLYAKYGVFLDRLDSIDFPESKEGKEKIRACIKAIQSNPPTSLANYSVVSFEDYRLSLRTNLKTGQAEQIDLPKSDTLLFWLEDGSKMVIRPSGTEPKIKFYCEVHEPASPSVEDALKRAEKKVSCLVDAAKQLFNC